MATPKVKPNLSEVEPSLDPTIPSPLPPVEITVEDVLQLQQTFESHREQAIQRLLEQQRTIQEQLQRLGYQDASTVVALKLKPAVGGKSIRPDAYCKYCEITGHDARLHRGQTKKRKFSQSELEEALRK